MTYRGSVPGSGYGQGQNGHQWPNNPNQNGVNVGTFDAYGNPQAQYPYQNTPQQYGQQYMHQNAVFAPPVGYPQEPMQHANYSTLHATQYQNYEPSYDQRPQQPSPQYNGAYMAPMGQSQSSAQRPVERQPVQYSNGQYMQPVQRQQPQPHAHHHQHAHPQHITDWQQMPPPGSGMAPPIASNQAMTTAQQGSALQHQQTMQQQIHNQHRQPISSHHANSAHLNSPHVHSPVTSRSPQLPHQLVPNKNRSASTAARIDQAGRISASPRLATQGLTRSPSVSSTKSPAPTPALIPHHQDTNSLLICVAEDMFTKARREVLGVADSLNPQSVQEYQKMIATGLGCLETVLGSNKLAPRLEAKLQLRYASILCEETNNVMEAETALTKGITLCDKVGRLLPLN
jgi:hypothetical protein